MIKKHLMPPNGTDQDRHTNGGNDTTTTTTGAEEPKSNIQQQNNPLPTDDVNQDIYIIAPEEAVRALSQSVESSNVFKNNLYFVRIRDQMVSRLELEATRNVILSVGILMLFSSPWIVSFVLSLVCNARVVHQTMGGEATAEALVEQCSRYHWAISYTRLTLLIGHTFYQFVGFLARRKDFCDGLGRAQRRRCIICCWNRRPSEILTNNQQQQRMMKRRGPRYNRQPRAPLRFEQLLRKDQVQ